MYTFKEITDKQLWDDFLENYPGLANGVSTYSFIQSSSWGDFQESLGKKVFRCGIYKDDALIGLSLGVIVEAKRGKYLYIRNGPVMDWSNKKLVEEVILQYKSWAKQNNLWFVRISPLIEKESVADENLKSYNFPLFAMNEVEALDTWLLDLQKSEEDILKELNKKTRYYINKTLKDGLTTFVTTDEKYLEDFYIILSDTVKRHKWNSYSLDYIKKEFNAFKKNNNADIILIKYQNKFIAGGIFIHFGSQSYYHYGASLSEYSNLAPQYLTIWEAIKQSKTRGKRYFNFWGIAPENKPKHPWAGLTLFKKKFDGFEQRWTPARDIPVSPLYWLTNIYERIDKVRKGY